MSVPSVLTNEIESFLINRNTISKRFTLFRATVADSELKRSYSKTVCAIQRLAKPISLAREPNGNFLLLMPLGKAPLANDNFGFKETSFDRISDGLVARLIIKGLPNIADDDEATAADGAYYLVGTRKIGSHRILRTVGVDIFQIEAERWALSIAATTFTPLAFHQDQSGNLRKEIVSLPRYTFDKWSRTVHKGINSEYVKRGVPNQKAEVSMISFDDYSYDKFKTSKSGVLARFMRDLDKFAGDMLSIKLKPIRASYRQRYGLQEIDKSYSRIRNILAGETIRVVDFSESAQIAEGIVEELVTAGYKAYLAQEISDDGINIVLVCEPSVYEKLGQHDPYVTIRDKHPGALIQAAHPDKIADIGDNSQVQVANTILEAILKEACIKLECIRGKLLIAEHNFNASYILVDKPKDGEHEYHCLDIANNNLSYRKLDRFDGLELTLDVALGRDHKDGDIFILDHSQNNFYAFEPTDLVALCDYSGIEDILAKIQKSNVRGISYGMARDYWESLDELERTTKFGLSLSSLLEENTGKRFIDSKEFGRHKIRFNSADGKRFYNWLEMEHGLLFKASLRSRDARYLEAATGLFFDEETSSYYVGNADNLKTTLPRFSRIRKIITDAPTVGNHILELMAAFHVRHRMATVLPYPFKILREFKGMTTI